MRISELELSFKAHKILKRSGIKTVEQLAKYDWTGFGRLRGCGKVTMIELIARCMELARGDMFKQALKWEEKLWASRWTKIREKLYEIQQIINGENLQ